MHRNKKNDNHCLSYLISYVSLSILALATTVGSTAIADDNYPEWSIKGFGSIGFARSDNETIGFYRDRTSTQEVKKSLEITTDSRLGLQLDVDINDSFHFTTQFVVRDHAGDFFEQNLDWAFLKWNPLVVEDYEIRVGRLGVDAFLLSDYRNVGYAYPWIRPPHEFYANIPLTHFDGADIKKSFYLENGELTLKLGGGYTFTKLSEYFQDFDLEGPVLVANIIYTTGEWRFRAGYGHIWQSKNLESSLFSRIRGVLTNPATNFLIPNLNQFLPLTNINDTHLQFMSLGTAYDDGTWLVHAEASYLDEEGQQIINADVASAYLSIGRRFSDVTLYSRYGIAHSFEKKTKALDINPLLVGTPNEPAIREINQQIIDGFNGQAIKQQSLSIGLRWDFYQKMAFKAEWTHYWLGKNGKFSSLWQHDPNENTPHHVNLVSFGIDFIF
ncbi:MAG: hypothetical protein KAH20_05750 [Methylococcales bacterium]|nr:hypothetical protein [Methylococcales bacterium]